MPIDPRMSITTPVTQLLGINHPILLAPMDLVADGRLVAAVDAAGGFGILGGGYGEEKWLVRELDLLDRSKARFGVGFITWSLAKQPSAPRSCFGAQTRGGHAFLRVRRAVHRPDQAHRCNRHLPSPVGRAREGGCCGRSGYPRRPRH